MIKKKVTKFASQNLNLELISNNFSLRITVLDLNRSSSDFVFKFITNLEIIEEKLR